MSSPLGTSVVWRTCLRMLLPDLTDWAMEAALSTLAVVRGTCAVLVRVMSSPGNTSSVLYTGLILDSSSASPSYLCVEDHEIAMTGLLRAVACETAREKSMSSFG